ncbi:PspC domain-containing protein [Streptomyces sp. NPDC012888]|uniref:PspC domain-containing protein n=1 Tax=Streptomyces sp. NPDC012888 TaxID=3364855 RepID=UPI0036879826
MTEAQHSPPADRDPTADRPPLRRVKRDKVVAGVCGGLGRYYDLDPVVFRIVLGVLALTGGLGLIFYGFAWLFLPLDGEEESEARKLLTGRIEGGTLAAVLAALVGCAVFLTMLDNNGIGFFSVLVIVAFAGAAHWSQRRRGAPAAGAAGAAEAEPAGDRPRVDAPPEAQAPPVPGSPSWWRDPLVKDGAPGTGYLWGPAGPDTAAAGPPPGSGGPHAEGGPPSSRGPRRPRSRLAWHVFGAALTAGIAGAAANWQGEPLGHALQMGLACALAVFGLGLLVSSLFGRTGLGTVLLALVTAALLGAAAALPRDIGTDFRQVDWRPAAVAEVRPSYAADTGLATLDLSRLDVAKGTRLGVNAAIRAGRLKVILPREVTAEADVRIRVGDIQMPGDRADRIEGVRDQRRTATLPPAAGTEAGGTIELHLTAGVGQVEVARATS